MIIRYELPIIRKKNYPNLDSFFKSFRTRDNLIIEVKPPKISHSSDTWTFKIKIISIALLQNSNEFPDKGNRFYEYKLIGQIISLNNKTILPRNFWWEEDAIDREIKIYFSTHGAKTLVFRTCEYE